MSSRRDKQIVRQLQRLQRRAGLKNREIAEGTGLSEGAVSRILRGLSRGPDSTEAIRDFLNETVKGDTEALA